MKYGEKYFSWQRSIGEFGGIANFFKFKTYIRPTDTVLDFGCGGGYLLDNIKTSGKKIGVEINNIARQVAAQKGIECHADFSDIPDSSVDVIISNHALEHVENPLEILKEFKRVIKSSGYIVVVVPHEMGKDVDLLDNNGHLFTWSPQTLVNLFKAADISVVDYHSICHLWPPHYDKIQRIFGWNVFHKLSWLYCKLHGKIYQTRVVGAVLKREEY